MPHRSFFYFLGLILSLAAFLLFDYSVRKEFVLKQQYNTAAVEVREKLKASTQVAAESVPDQAAIDKDNFIKKFKSFAVQINLKSNDPDRTEEFLKQFVNTLKPQNFSTLGEILANANYSNDDRTLALEILSARPTFESHQALNSFIQNESFGKSRAQDFELGLRAQAIEALTLFADKKEVRKNLENIKIRTRHAFLYDRAHKAATYMSGRLPSEDLEPDAQAIKK
jgi:hypothetical protein